MVRTSPGDAVLSPCRRYRYHLHRDIPSLFGRRRALFVMFNPSTADATKDDHTISKCIGFGERWECSRIEVVNLFAWRSKDPERLLDARDPVGPENDEHIAAALTSADLVVCAWGALPRIVAHLYGRRMEQVWKLVQRHRPQCLGLTADGYPCHPLILAYATPLEPFLLRSAA